MAIEFKQEFISGYCKLCGINRQFVTHTNNPDKMVCCFCFYSKSVKDNEKEKIIPNYTYYATVKEEE